MRHPAKERSAWRRSCARSVLAAAVLVLLCACGPPKPQNVVLVSFDTLRADHLGSYGYSRDASPNLDAFAATALRYERAYAPSPWTLPSHAAMLTGAHPYSLGIVDFGGALPEDAPTLAEAFAAAGYQTAGFVDSAPRGLIGSARGFSRGFDRYEHAPFSEPAPYKYDAAATVDAGLAWLRGRDPERPFFLFLHTKSVHTAPRIPSTAGDSLAPYHKPLPWRTRYLPQGGLRFAWEQDGVGGGASLLRRFNERIARGELDPASFSTERVQELVDLYDGGIAYADAEFGRLLAGLSAEGLDGSTVVAVAADHGEAFLEHRFFLHNEVYDVLLHVPLMIRDPAERRPRVVSRRVDLQDLAPTLLARAKVAVVETLGGRELPHSDAEAAPAPPSFHYYLSTGVYGEAFAVRQGPWKLVHTRLPHWSGHRTELFRVSDDPGEEHPLGAQDDEEVRQELLGRLESWLSEAAREGAPRITLDAETIEQLRALGYAP